MATATSDDIDRAGGDNGSKYLKDEIGDALVQAVAKICDARPDDPISFLANELYDYRIKNPIQKNDIVNSENIVNDPNINDIDVSNNSTGDGLDETSESIEDEELEEGKRPVKSLLRIIKNSSSMNDRLDAIIYIRRDLSDEMAPPIQKYVDAGAIQIVIDCLQDKEPQIQFEAAWVLTNIAAGSPEQTHAVFEGGAVPLLLNLLRTSEDSSVRDQSIWTLGNLMGDKSPNITNFIIVNGFIEMLMDVICKVKSLGERRDLAWCIINLVRNKSVEQLTHKRVRKLLPVIYYLLNDTDNQVMMDAIWALSYVADLHTATIQDILDMGLVPKLINFLNNEATLPGIMVPTLRTIGNLITGSDQQTQHVLDAGLIDNFSSLLNFELPDNLRREALWCISNITAGTAQQIQEVLDADLLGKILNLLENGGRGVQKEALWVIGNMAQGSVKYQLEKINREFNVLDVLVKIFVRELPILLPNEFEDEFIYEETARTFDSGFCTFESSDFENSLLPKPVTTAVTSMTTTSSITTPSTETFYIKNRSRHKSFVKILHTRFGADSVAVWVESIENFVAKIANKKKLFEELHDSDGIFCLHCLAQYSALRPSIQRTFENLNRKTEVERMLATFITPVDLEANYVDELLVEDDTEAGDETVDEPLWPLELFDN